MPPTAPFPTENRTQRHLLRRDTDLNPRLILRPIPLTFSDFAPFHRVCFPFFSFFFFFLSFETENPWLVSDFYLLCSYNSSLLLYLGLILNFSALLFLSRKNKKKIIETCILNTEPIPGQAYRTPLKTLFAPRQEVKGKGVFLTNTADWRSRGPTVWSVNLGSKTYCRAIVANGKNATCYRQSTNFANCKNIDSTSRTW